MNLLPEADIFFLPYQARWIADSSPLKLIEKSRQVGISFADAYDSVSKAGETNARMDVWVSSRDDTQARLYLEDCKRWSEVLNLAASWLGPVLVDSDKGGSVYALEFTNGRRVYSLSSNPNALAGKRGHVKLDEFALHANQRLLYRVAKPVTQWGGTLSVISTHRGAQTLFNQFVRGIREGGNPMGWSLHSAPIQLAVEQGLVERINERTGRNESREAFLRRLHSECVDEEQWLQEYCCVAADESHAFFSFPLITACEESTLQLQDAELLDRLAFSGPLYLGVDVARRKDLCVLDLGEKLGDVVWDRARIELENRSFSEIKFELYRLLRLPGLQRACIDATGLGMQLAEEAEADFGWRVEPIAFTAAVKEKLAFGLRTDLQDHKVRLVRDEKLRADLRGLRKELSLAGHIRFVGESEDGHCDRTWALALRQHAAREREGVAGFVC